MNSEKCQLENFLLYWYLDAACCKALFFVKTSYFWHPPGIVR